MPKIRDILYSYLIIVYSYSINISIRLAPYAVYILIDIQIRDSILNKFRRTRVNRQMFSIVSEINQLLDPHLDISRRRWLYDRTIILRYFMERIGLRRGCYQFSYG